MWQFLFFILFIIIMHILSKTLEEAQKRTSTYPEEKEYEIIGFPPIETSPSSSIPPEKKPKKIPITKIETPQITPKEEKPLVPNKTLSVKPDIKPAIDLDNKKLEEAIILSEILGPPKALRR